MLLMINMYNTMTFLSKASKVIKIINQDKKSETAKENDLNKLKCLIMEIHFLVLPYH